MSQLLPTKLPRLSTSIPISTLASVLVAVIAITALYFGREVLVPIALALLLSFVLAPLVQFLQAWYCPRIVAVLLVGVFAFSIIFSLGAFMVSQVTELANDLPGYQSTLREKIQSLRGAAGGAGPLERASDVLKDLSKEIDKPGSGVPSLDERATASRPIPVEVRQPDPGAMQVLVGLITPLIHPLTTTGIVVIFVIFILIQRQDLRNRLVRLAGAQDLQRTTAALDDAGQRLSRLFLTQLPKCSLWRRDRSCFMVYRCPKRTAVGHAGDDHAFCAVYRRNDLRDFSLGSGGGRRSGLDNGSYDCITLSDYRNNRRAGNRATRLRPKHRAFPGGRYHVRNLLDLALGADRPDPRNSADHVSGRCWAGMSISSNSSR